MRFWGSNRVEIFLHFDPTQQDDVRQKHQNASYISIYYIYNE